MDFKTTAQKYIDENAEKYIGVSHKIWEYAELSLKEFKSAALYIEKLKEEGFEVTENLGGIKTAFCGSWGKGKPVIGVLGEFDALAGLSQKAAAAEKAPLLAGGAGHGCGHNMLGAASFAAACAIKNYLQQSGKGGTVIFYGCPGEEGGASKAFLAREGVWKNLDAALTWHPGDTNEVTTGTCNSCIQVLYKFKGVSAHAAGDPEMGRSALDAAELMNVGANYLREHMKTSCRIHYAMVDCGGVSPNVVQDSASVLYMVRSIAVQDSIDLAARVDKIAEGAALMTETSVEKVFIDGCANTVPNSVLEKLVYDQLTLVPVPAYTEAEWEYAKKVKALCPKRDDLPGYATNVKPEIATYSKEKSQNGTRAINDFVIPFYTGNDFTPGSTDVGDVSWLTPTVQFNTACEVAGSPGHSWQIVSCGASSIGDKGLIQAAKVLACSGIEIFEHPEVLVKAREEFEERTKCGYACPIPQGEEPKAI